jgi:tRNA (adenine57-N1/adenine58-N1)-methyltransferase
VCKDGFGDVTQVEAVFLDLPAPWEAIPLVLANLRPDCNTKICCFSPCIEQVTRTCTALREHGFSDISTQEVLVRVHELPPPPKANANTSGGNQPFRDVTSIVAGLKAHEERKAERRIVQMRNAREKAARAKAAAEAAELGEGGDGEETRGSEAPRTGEKRKADEAVEAEAYADADADGQDADDVDADMGIDSTSSDSSPSKPSGSGSGSGSGWTAPPEPTSTLASQIMLRTQPEMRGHTSYLTFATLAPKSIRDALAARDTRSGAATPVTRGAGSAAAAAGTGSARAGPVDKAPVLMGSAAAATGIGGGRDDATEVTEATEVTAATDYGDQALEQAMGTLTEEDLAAMLGD